MENYYIFKEGAHEQDELSKLIDEQEDDMTGDLDENDIMNLSIKAHEVDNTSRTCIRSPGADN